MVQIPRKSYEEVYKHRATTAQHSRQPGKGLRDIQGSLGSSPLPTARAELFDFLLHVFWDLISPMSLAQCPDVLLLKSGCLPAFPLTVLEFKCLSMLSLTLTTHTAPPPPHAHHCTFQLDALLQGKLNYHLQSIWRVSEALYLQC